MSEAFDHVVAVKRRSHRSWANFRSALLCSMGAQGTFGTQNVRAASLSYLNAATAESGLSTAQILAKMDEYRLGLS